MSSSRIEQIIEEIEEYVEGCRYQPLSTTKIIVNKEELEELLRELRLKTPDEIKRYQRIIENRDAILSDAQAKADALLNDAEEKARKLVSETEIIKEAYAQADATLNDANQQAQDILDSAQQDANDIRTSAITYTDSLLSSISEVMSNTIQDVGQSYNDFAG
ncbi:MAG TPA: ATPase, partial [Lachnospiraceae bacterium]|nr:ATPase [Lachnospiraceae bacterium]